MSIEVKMGECQIVAKSTSERYIWTSGVGDCLAIAAQNDSEILFAHLTGRQYYPESMGGGFDEAIVIKVKKFLAQCTRMNVLVATNFRHSGDPRLFMSPASRLGYDYSQLRYGGDDKPGPVTLDMNNFQLYFSTPEDVNDQCNVLNDKYGWTNSKVKKGAKARCECILM
jgi:hypothetical protein